MFPWEKQKHGQWRIEAKLTLKSTKELFVFSDLNLFANYKHQGKQVRKWERPFNAMLQKMGISPFLTLTLYSHFSLINIKFGTYML